MEIDTYQQITDRITALERALKRLATTLYASGALVIPRHHPSKATPSTPREKAVQARGRNPADIPAFPLLHTAQAAQSLLARIDSLLQTAPPAAPGAPDRLARLKQARAGLVAWLDEAAPDIAAESDAMTWRLFQYCPDD